MLREPVVIYVFSGSGNTWTVARKIADVFLEEGISSSIRPLLPEGPGDISIPGTVGLAFPVAMFTAYPFVWEFIENLPDGRGRDIFMVDTLAGFSGGIVGPLKRKVIQKGYRPIGASEIRMPSNYSRNQPEGQKDVRIREKGLQKAISFAKDLLNGRAAWWSIPLVPDIISRLGRSPDSAAWRYARRKYPLAANSEKCTRCGLCVKLCPVGNIAIDDLPVFGDRCFFCQRCISFCPCNAIEIAGQTTEPYRGMDPEDLKNFLGI